MKIHKAFLVCFIGMDGSGKTTQAQALVESFNEKGVKSKYVHNRFQAFLTQPFITIGKELFFRKKGKFEDYDEFVVTRGKVLQNRLLYRAYQNLLLLDYSLRSVFRVTIPLMFGKNIICDRYIFDTIVDLAVDLEYSDSKIELMLNRLSRLFPKPDMIFLMDVPAEMAYERKDDIASLEFLRERRSIYLDIAKQREAVVVDSTSDPAKLKMSLPSIAIEAMSRPSCKKPDSGRFPWRT